MILTELFSRKPTIRSAEREMRREKQPVVNPAKLAAQYRASREGGNKGHTARLWRELDAAVGTEKAEALVKSQDSTKKQNSSEDKNDVWSGRA